MNIAVFGDIHGEWVKMSEVAWQLHRKVKLDAILQCGDAMPIRSEEDLAYVSVPAKYRKMGDFTRIWSGAVALPAPFLFIGGNHEPYNYLDQYADGGFIAQGIYYLGRAGFRMLNESFSISGLSGVYSEHNFEQPCLEWPYDVSQHKRATYYNRRYIQSMSDHPVMNILLLHEWPDIMNRAIGENSWLKQRENIGRPELTALIDAKAPRWTFCGHMHTRASYNHEGCQIVCLGDFSTDPINSCGVLNTDNNAVVWLDNIL